MTQTQGLYGHIPAMDGMNAYPFAACQPQAVFFICRGGVCGFGPCRMVGHLLPGDANINYIGFRCCLLHTGGGGAASEYILHVLPAPLGKAFWGEDWWTGRTQQGEAYDPFALNALFAQGGVFSWESVDVDALQDMLLAQYGENSIIKEELEIPKEVDLLSAVLSPGQLQAVESLYSFILGKRTPGQKENIQRNGWTEPVIQEMYDAYAGDSEGILAYSINDSVPGHVYKLDANGNREERRVGGMESINNTALLHVIRLMRADQSKEPMFFETLHQAKLLCPIQMDTSGLPKNADGSVILRCDVPISLVSIRDIYKKIGWIL